MGAIIMVGVAIFVLIGVFITFVDFGNRGEEVTTSAPNRSAVVRLEPAAKERMAAVVAQARHFKGDNEAPVTIVEISEFT